jgi:hypothetical protein
LMTNSSHFKIKPPQEIAFKAIGFKQHQSSILSATEEKTHWKVEEAKIKKTLLTLNGDLIVFRKEERRTED